MDQDQIDQHDRIMQEWIDSAIAGVSPLLVQLFDSIAGLQSPTRLQIQQLFVGVIDSISTSFNNIQPILTSNIALNSSVLGTAISPAVDQQLQRVIAISRQQTVDALVKEQSDIIAAIELAVIGGSVALVIRELRRAIPDIIRRVGTVFGSIVRGIDSAFTFLRGKEQNVNYRYSGPRDSDNRDFCSQMSGQILSEEQIRRVWNTQTWGGKRAGDPFVTRGGWNCRHVWTPEGK
jgi:hypothetical protein